MWPLEDQGREIYARAFLHTQQAQRTFCRGHSHIAAAAFKIVKVRCHCCSASSLYLQEQYEEIVFVNPSQAFYQRMMQHQPRSRVPLSIEPYVQPPSEQEGLAVIQEARRKVAQISAGLRMQLQQPMADSPSGMGMHM